MSKVTMPGPVAEFRIDQLGNVREPFFTGETGNLYAGYYKAITTDQAEAYAAAKVREALEEYAKLLEGAAAVLENATEAMEEGGRDECGAHEARSMAQTIRFALIPE